MIEQNCGGRELLTERDPGGELFVELQQRVEARQVLEHHQRVAEVLGRHATLHGLGQRQRPEVVALQVVTWLVELAQVLAPLALLLLALLLDLLALLLALGVVDLALFAQLLFLRLQLGESLLFLDLAVGGALVDRHLAQLLALQLCVCDET